MSIDEYYEMVVTPNSYHDLFYDFLTDTLPIGFEYTDDSFIVRSEENLETIAWGIEQFSEALQRSTGDVVEVSIEIEKKKSSDWIEKYKHSISPIEISPFYIHPTWEEPKDGMLNIAIDPALAFGTGHHPTTASSLSAIAEYVKKDFSVLDIGSGSGILSIASALLGAKVDACDTDEVAVTNTKENSKNNSIELLNVWQGSVMKAPRDSYDVVIANIVADVLLFIANDISKVLKPNGFTILSGIMEPYKERILKAYDSYNILKIIQKDEWITLVLQKGQ